jgi:hypothetical protein
MKKLTRGRPSASAVLGNEMIGPIVGEVRGVQSMARLGKSGGSPLAAINRCVADNLMAD